MKYLARVPCQFVLLGLAILALAGCATQAPPAMNIAHVDGSGTADSLLYVIEASGYGVEESGTVTYIFECERHPDGTSVLTITTGDGDAVATATRSTDGAVDLETAAGFGVSGNDGTIEIAAADRHHLPLVVWALLDASIFSWYEMPPDLPNEANLRAWRDDLTLIESVEPVVEDQGIAPAFWEDAYTNYAFFGGVGAVRINITCIPF